MSNLKTQFINIFLILVSGLSYAQTWDDSIVKTTITNPSSYPYGVSINTTYTGPWAREFSFTRNNTGKLLSFGVYANGNNLGYGYIGGNSSSTSTFSSPWMVFKPSGNIGIGVTNPQSKMDVNGTIKGNTYFHLGPNYDANNRGIVVDGGASTIWNLLELKNDDGVKMKVSGNGNVGIGTITPSYKLTLKTELGNQNHLRFENEGEIGLVRLTNDGNLDIWSHGNDEILFRRGTGSGLESMRITADGNVGIGTVSPSVRLDVKGGSTSLSGYLNIYDFDNDGGASTLISRDGNTEFWNGGVVVGQYSNNVVGSLSQGDLVVKGTVGIGTTNPGAYKLAVNGKIHTKEVAVDMTGWPDYVFSPSYDLLSLDEVKQHIKEKGHLPNMPSAQEVQENGIELGKMNAKLLEKIEELTLYLLNQDERMKILEEQNNIMQTELRELEKN